MDRKKGSCDACSAEYDKEVYEVDSDSRFAGYVVQPCPNCKYNPNDEKKIRTILQDGIELTIDSRGHIRSNHHDLAALIVKHIHKIWPKAGDSKK